MEKRCTCHRENLLGARRSDGVVASTQWVRGNLKRIFMGLLHFVRNDTHLINASYAIIMAPWLSLLPRISGKFSANNGRKVFSLW